MDISVAHFPCSPLEKSVGCFYFSFCFLSKDKAWSFVTFVEAGDNDYEELMPRSGDLNSCEITGIKHSQSGTLQNVSKKYGDLLFAIWWIELKRWRKIFSRMVYAFQLISLNRNMEAWALRGFNLQCTAHSFDNFVVVSLPAQAELCSSINFN